MKPFINGLYSKRKEFAHAGANSFLLEMTTSEKGGKNENGRVAVPESVPIFLKEQISSESTLTDTPVISNRLVHIQTW